MFSDDEISKLIKKSPESFINLAGMVNQRNKNLEDENERLKRENEKLRIEANRRSVAENIYLYQAYGA